MRPSKAELAARQLGWTPSDGERVWFLKMGCAEVDQWVVCRAIGKVALGPSVGHEREDYRFQVEQRREDGRITRGWFSLRRLAPCFEEAP